MRAFIGDEEKWRNVENKEQNWRIFGIDFYNEFDIIIQSNICCKCLKLVYMEKFNFLLWSLIETILAQVKGALQDMASECRRRGNGGT